MPVENTVVAAELPAIDDAAAAAGRAARRSGTTSSLPPLITRIAAGEQAALAELYDDTVAKLLGFALLIVRDREDAEEVVCDVYLQVWRAPLRYDPGRGSVLAWLFGICRARAIDRCRRNRAWTRNGSVAGAPDSDGGAAGGEPCDFWEKFEQGSAIRQALARLSPTRRRLLALAFFQDLSHEEISIETQLPIGTVKSHIRRALAALRGELDPGGGNGSTQA